MDVYLDAAFFPKIDELSFKQEGHRIEIMDQNDDDIELEYKGVVYNEMKGAMSSPGQVMGRSLLTALYPDTTYQHNSGGEPCDIPSLTWEALREFHATYYHPSNAQFYTYAWPGYRECESSKRLRCPASQCEGKVNQRL